LSQLQPISEEGGSRSTFLAYAAAGTVGSELISHYLKSSTQPPDPTGGRCSVGTFPAALPRFTSNEALKVFGADLRQTLGTLDGDHHDREF
jgi:hypothetical protein